MGYRNGNQIGVDCSREILRHRKTPAICAEVSNKRYYSRDEAVWKEGGGEL
jgi:hypothetical protein